MTRAIWRLCLFNLVVGLLFLCMSEAANLASPVFVGAIMYVQTAPRASHAYLRHTLRRFLPRRMCSGHAATLAHASSNAASWGRQ